MVTRKKLARKVGAFLYTKDTATSKVRPVKVTQCTKHVSKPGMILRAPCGHVTGALDGIFAVAVGCYHGYAQNLLGVL